MTDSIHTSVKMAIGVAEEYEHFDPVIVMHINTYLAILNHRKAEKHIKKDDGKLVYFTYGEIVLAEFLGNESCPESDHAKGENDFTNQELIDIVPLTNTDIKKLDGLRFSVDGHTLCPFYEIIHGRYRIYFETE